jgi:hypothetical protein
VKRVCSSERTGVGVFRGECARSSMNVLTETVVSGAIYSDVCKVKG